ncbi:MAG TPA: alpha/beta hydrolase-fold protein [Bryobacteraceae bacterium]|jgi:enterochelin esterase-like enzyme
MTWKPALAATILAACVSIALPPAGKAQGTAKPGKWEKIKVHGKALEGNLEGDSPDRDVFVYLPASYATNSSRRYPVVYFLHGYAAHAETYWNSLSVPAAADTAGAEMILVLPDAYTIYDGSMFSNSPTTGDWETFVADDLVTHIDGHYRTIANRAARGLSGHSMGGYGTVRIGMKHPDAFGALYAMSSCCLLQDPVNLVPGQASTGKQAPAADSKGKQGGGGALAKALQAQAAAWAPNPQNPPEYFDLPTKNGELQPLVASKWTANSPLLMVDQYVANLKRYRAIEIEVGTRDPFVTLNTQLSQALMRLGVQHKFETYDGDHSSRIKARFADNLLPFFKANLSPAK